MLQGLFSCFFLLFKDFPVFLFFTVWPGLFFFSSKNFEFSGIFLHMENSCRSWKTWKTSKSQPILSKSGKSQGFFYTEGCVHVQWNLYKADISIRRTAWQGTDCSALRSNYLRKNLYKADISIKRTLFFAPMVSALWRFHCTFFHF